ncbi:putative signal transducing protein [Flavihumibacter sp.]|uniref:putative signal transducing protein n=1 Tax=Flavihumibacter sp. TaxID=1913981 RepID=UPI002FCBD835
MEFQQVRSYDNYIAANLQLNLLKEQGISCYLKDEMTITIDPLLSPAIGGMKLMVASPEADRALQLLDAADENYLHNVACPSCGQTALEKITHVVNPVGFWAQLKNKLINGSVVSLSTRYQCKACGASWSSIPA